MTQGQRSVPQSMLDAAGLGAAATSGSGSPSPGSPPPASTATSTTAAPEKESYAAHYARPVGSSPKQSMEGGDDVYGGISGGGLAYDESEGGHGADKGLAPQAQAQASRPLSDSAHHLPNSFDRAVESDSEEEESEEGGGGGRKVLRVANE
ncbi:hypothetical protein VKT23_020189 [Stygiomarasmius scandens]|uniref:Uncharacterized protein n=1 Tax=Marasmiellus scandens TaxID=2682957 RepID=A0ABR1INK7_9AGAR